MNVRRKLTAAAAAFTAAMWLAGAAPATEAPPVDLQLAGPGALAVNGQPYQNTLRITLPQGGTLANLGAGQQGWNVTSLGSLPVGAQPPGAVIDVPFTALPGDTGQPLEFALEWNGIALGTSFDLSLDGYERATTDRPVIAMPIPAGALTAPPPGWRNPLNAAGAGDVPSGTPGDKDRSITVHGTFHYVRSDGVPVGAFGVRADVYDDDGIGNKKLGSTYVDFDGTYSVTFTWQEGIWHEDDPDIFVRFVADNDIVHVKAGMLATNAYRWRSATTDDFTGSDLAMGSLGPADAADYPACHILADITKAWTWLEARSVAPDVQVTVLWPMGTSACYIGWPLNRIRVGTDREWREDTHIHEYGHHWMYKFNVDAGLFPHYCNGYADSGPGCGHKQWCEENAEDAWDEGVPDWIADQVTQALDEYGPASGNFRTAEDIDQCDEDNSYHDPLVTQGFIHALLNDLVDDTPDETDPARIADWADDFHGLDAGELLRLLADNDIHDVATLIDQARPLFTNPAPLWETAAFNGYLNLDTTPPSSGMTISSSSHDVGVPSANNTLELAISQPTDDFSGVNAYEIHVNAGSPLVPVSHSPAVLGEGAVVFYTSDALAPGSYYVTVRPRDRDGNWSTGYAVAGPFVVREPTPVDITYGRSLGAGVAGPLVLRDDATAVPALVQWSDTLPGDSGDVYWNLATENEGEEAAGAFSSRLRLDGQPVPGAVDAVPGLAGLTVRAVHNQGPRTFPAGLHTVSARFDSGHDLAEEDETDNAKAVRVVFLPPVLSPLATGQRAAPPGATAGHDDFTGPPTLRAPNQDGLRFTVGTAFDALAVWANDPAQDYDCRLYAPSTSVSAGFGHPVIGSEAASGRGAGLVDLVFTNANLPLPHTTWDVGVLNFDEGTAPYNFAHVRSQPVTQNTAQPITFGPDARVALRGLQLNGGELGWKEVTLTADPAAGAFNVAWFPAATLAAGLDDATAQARTDATGAASLEVEATAAGRQLLVVWRDPVDDPAAKLAETTVTLRVRVSRPDLAFEESPAGWIGPVVPRPDPAGTPASVPEPVSLAGDIAATWLNARVLNQGLAAAPAFSARLEIDGQEVETASLPACAAGASVAHNGSIARTVRSGRHTLSVVADTGGTVNEAAEGNNRFGEQFAWVPPDLPDAGISTRPAPVGIVAGWDGVSAARAPLRVNCDGYYLSPPGGAWYGVAVQPDDSTDVDLRLYEAATGARAGFLDPVAISGWGRGEMDFVLVNSTATAARPFHVGIAGISGAGDYQLDRLTSDFLATEPEGTYGPFEVAADELVQLHAMSLLAGVYHIALVDAGATDLMFSLHGGDLPYGTRSRPVVDGESMLVPDRARETLDIIIAAEGNYCLAVWRRPGAGAGALAAKAAAGYTLEFGATTATPRGPLDARPVSLTGVWPTPFNARLSAAFNVQAAGRVRLGVYDLSGRRVRVLVDDVLAPGSRTVVWDGLDQRGSAAPAGVYLLRLDGGGHTEHRKVALVK